MRDSADDASRLWVANERKIRAHSFHGRLLASPVCRRSARKSNERKVTTGELRAGLNLCVAALHLPLPGETAFGMQRNTRSTI